MIKRQRILYEKRVSAQNLTYHEWISQQEKNIKRIQGIINLLQFEYDRMSETGKQLYDELIELNKSIVL